ncbi:hypothetical protein [Streptacidiphilus sp. MAP12-20]|uniref:hypothetical protein n=1 Tax=Streptacidiphilus sp. MAP12-20 TaxID=3156299 RepID=UPI0035136252
MSSGQKALVVTVVIGTVIIALIGFGWFSCLLPIGIDVGITVLLAPDLLLTWMRIPLPILRKLAFPSLEQA